MAYSWIKKRNILERIYKNYASGKYTIVSCIEKEGITYKTFKKWDAEYQALQNSNEKSKISPTFSKKSNKKSKKVQKENPDGTIEEQEVEKPTHIKGNPTSYKEAAQSADINRKKKLKEIALSALEYHLQIQEYEETKQHGKVIPAKKKGDKPEIKPEKLERIKKRKDPNPMLIRFALENVDPENFKRKQEIEHRGENPFLALMKALDSGEDKEHG